MNLLAIVKGLLLFVASANGFITPVKSGLLQNTGLNAVASRGKLWDQRTVPYVFSRHYTSAEKTIIKKIMRKIEMQSCVRFDEWDTQREFAFIKKGLFCDNPLGKTVYGQVNVFLYSDTGTPAMKKQCADKTNILNELLKVLGGYTIEEIKSLYKCSNRAK